MKQLVELQSLIPAAHRKDTPVVAVSPDPPADAREMIRILKQRTGGDFALNLLSDAQHTVIDRYGLRSVAASEEHGSVLPHPTTYVIDKTGKVRWKFTEKNYAVRPTNDMILAELKKLW